jgi:RNA polymerase sigma-70 factor (ECF subfamily)
MAQRAGATLDSAELATLTEPFRRELLAHCYRMLGSVDEAEGLVQETYLRAWRSHGGFEGRSSVRTWLYRIVTNACLTAVQCRARRPLPSGLAGPAGGPSASADAGLGGHVAAADSGRAGNTGIRRSRGRRVSRESLRLALIASLQYLPLRQRAVLILREVLDFPAAEVAGMLGMTTTAVKSALQRARARLEQAQPAADQVTEPAEPEVRALLEGRASGRATTGGCFRRRRTGSPPRRPTCAAPTESTARTRSWCSP